MLQGKVIDADGHVLEPPDLWSEYLESKYRNRAIRMEKDAEGFEYLVIDGRPSVVSRGIGPLGAGIGQPFQEIFQPGAFGYLDGPQGAYDAHARLKLMDEEGIDISVIYPSIGLLWEMEVQDSALISAYARAYNNWIIETGGGWIAHMLEHMEAKWRKIGYKGGLKHPPSEYFRRQCWISFDPDETTIPYMAQKYGTDRFMWATDFPHWDASPAALSETREAIRSLSKNDQQNILGDNVARVLNLS